jgi:hypothetical protein
MKKLKFSLKKIGLTYINLYDGFLNNDCRIKDSLTYDNLQLNGKSYQRLTAGLYLNSVSLE